MVNLCLKSEFGPIIRLDLLKSRLMKSLIIRKEVRELQFCRLEQHKEELHTLPVSVGCSSMLNDILTVTAARSPWDKMLPDLPLHNENTAKREAPLDSSYGAKTSEKTMSTAHSSGFRVLLMALVLLGLFAGYVLVFERFPSFSGCFATLLFFAFLLFTFIHLTHEGGEVSPSQILSEYSAQVGPDVVGTVKLEQVDIANSGWIYTIAALMAILCSVAVGYV